MGDRGSLLFVPFASSDPDTYTGVMRQTLAPRVLRSPASTRPGTLTAAVADAQAVFGGGGNSFRLLRTLTTLGVLEPLRQAAQAGVPYLAASAGGNLAGPAIRTTNDMPIVEPGSLAALGLIPFQLNPHYLDPDPRSPHRGETRPARIEEFLAENDVPVLGLREGAWLQVSGTRAHLSGRNTGRLFRRPTGPSTSRPARTCPTCSTPAPASTSAPQLGQGAGAALAAAVALPGRAGPSSPAHRRPLFDPAPCP